MTAAQLAERIRVVKGQATETISSTAHTAHAEHATTVSGAVNPYAGATVELFDTTVSANSQDASVSTNSEFTRISQIDRTAYTESAVR